MGSPAPGGGGGGGLPYETDGDARRLAYRCKFWILVSLRVFWAKRQYFMQPTSRLGFCEETQNYVGLDFFSIIMSLYHKNSCMSYLYVLSGLF